MMMIVIIVSDDDDNNFSPQKRTIAGKKPQSKKRAVEETPKPVSVTAVKSSSTLFKKAGKSIKKMGMFYFIIVKNGQLE